MILDIKNFDQPDLKVRYFRLDGKDQFKVDSFEVLYHIIIFLSGRNEIHYDDKIYIAKKNDVFITRYDEKFKLRHNNSECEYIHILFGMNTFKNTDDTQSLLKPFEQYNRLKIYNDSLDKEAFKSTLTALKKALDTHSNRPFIYACVLQLICEINYAYTKMSPPEIKDTDSKFALIENYIDNHIFENIMLEDVVKGTFLSKRCIQYTIKKICHMSFRRYINKRKLDKSKNLLKNKRVSLNKASQMLGFETYSTFYRAFKKEFGTTPNKYRDENKKPQS